MVKSRTSFKSDITYIYLRLLYLQSVGESVGGTLRIKHTCLDILTRVFGYLITRVWICSLPGIKGHPCDPNEATQLDNYLMHY